MFQVLSLCLLDFVPAAVFLYRNRPTKISLFEKMVFANEK